MAHQKSSPEIDARVAARAEKLQLLLFDVDGVLTNGTLIFSSEGEESKGFNTQDGFGIRLLQEAGIEVGVITARKSAAVARRCENLKMSYIYQGDSNKLKAYSDIVRKSGFKPFEIGYMGDDWLDLVLLKPGWICRGTRKCRYRGQRRCAFCYQQRWRRRCRAAGL